VSQESPFSFNTKIGNDMFTIRGASYDELYKNLMDASSVPSVRAFINLLDGLPEEAQAITTVQNTLGATVVSTPPLPSVAPAMAQAVATSTPAPTPSVGGGRTCSHGQMTARQGTGKDGKTWRGYMCPAPQGATDKCKNIYIYPNQPEWHTFVAS